MSILPSRTLRRFAWRYPASYGAIRQVRQAANRLSAKLPLGTGVRPASPEFEQIRRVMRQPESQRLLRTKGDGPSVLFFSLRGIWTTHTAWETVIALGLKLRGARPTLFTCAGALPACCIEGIGHPVCSTCYTYLLDFAQPFGLPVRVLEGMVADNQFEGVFHEIESLGGKDLVGYEYDKLPLGRIALPTVRWTLRRGTLAEDEQTLGLFRAFLKSGVIVANACEKLLASRDYDVIFCLNGEFFAEEILRAVASGRGRRVVTYERGFRPGSLFFQHEGAACKYDVNRHWKKVADEPLMAEEERRLDNYLAERRGGARGIGGVLFWPSMESDASTVRDRLSLDTVRPLATLFTNTPFDTATQGTEVAFPDMFEWIEGTIRYFAAHPEWQLVVRVHPSEVRDARRESREPVADRIAVAFDRLPDNVHVVPPESTLSSYTLMSLSRAALVYTSTAGLEMALNGKPAVLAGKAHYRGKGFTLDASSPAEFFSMAGRCMADGDGVTASNTDLARRYANLFFFRAMVPFDLLSEPERGQVRLNFDNLSDLLPGRNEGFDLVCEGIASGSDFLMPRGFA